MRIGLTLGRSPRTVCRKNAKSKATSNRAGPAEAVQVFAAPFDEVQISQYSVRLQSRLALTPPAVTIKRPVTAGKRATLTLASFPRKLSGYKNLDIFGPYTALENIKENDFCEKPATFEDKGRDVVAPVHRDQ